MDQTPELEVSFDLDSDPTVVRASRWFVARYLAELELEVLVDDAALVASELVTNAVVHAAPPGRLTLRSDGLRWLRIEVADASPRRPVRGRAADGATTGRGLALVDAIGSRWGVDGTPRGKIVWAELGLPRPEPAPGELDLRGVHTVEATLDHIEQSRTGPDAGRSGQPGRSPAGWSA